jgi:glutathione S-transferase
MRTEFDPHRPDEAIKTRVAPFDIDHQAMAAETHSIEGSKRMVTKHEEQDRQRVLYGFWLSPFMSLVAQMLKESGLDFRYERVSPYLGGTIADEHKARNPLGKIPTLEDTNGVIVSESQAICRYLARAYPSAAEFYPCDDPFRCAEVDALNDFITFSISGPFFNWFVVSGYFPRAFGIKAEHESQIFSTWSRLMIRGALARLGGSVRARQFLLGQGPYLPDFHLFHILELGRTFSALFEIPFMNLLEGDERLQNFYDVMAARPFTKEILAAQAQEFPVTEQELFRDFGPAYDNMLKPTRGVLRAMFGHEV